MLSAADRSLGELAGLGRMLPNPHLLIRPFLHREAVLSSRIEGTQANAADVFAHEIGYGQLPGFQSAAPESGIREVGNYVRALEYGLERLATLPVSLRLIRELHERLMSGVRGDQATPGEFRRTQNWIGVSGSTLNGATYVPPPVAEMWAALDALEKYTHAEDAHPPLVRLAFVHYQFEAIHPFLDGNGRIGRLLIALLLIEWNLLPLPLLYLSAYFERHREQYYELLLAVSQRSAWREWTVYFLRGVSDQARDTVDRVKRLQDLQREWRDRLARLGASSRAIQLADSLFDTPMLTIPQAQKVLGVTYRAAQGNVQRLVEIGALRPVAGREYGKVFVAEAVLQAIGD